MNLYVATVSEGSVLRVTVRPEGYEPGAGEVVVGPANLVGVGWSYEDGQFIAPEPEPDPEPET